MFKYENDYEFTYIDSPEGDSFFQCTQIFTDIETKVDHRAQIALQPV